MQGSSTPKHLPITIDILQVIKRSLNLHSRDHIMLWAASCLGFLAFYVLANLLEIRCLTQAFIWGLVILQFLGGS